MVARINSIWHNMVVLNVSQHMTVFIGHALLMKYAQCLQIVQKGQKMRFLAISWSLESLIDLILRTRVSLHILD